MDGAEGELHMDLDNKKWSERKAGYCQQWKQYIPSRCWVLVWY